MTEQMQKVIDAAVDLHPLQKAQVAGRLLAWAGINSETMREFFDQLDFPDVNQVAEEADEFIGDIP